MRCYTRVLSCNFWNGLVTKLQYSVASTEQNMCGRVIETNKQSQFCATMSALYLVCLHRMSDAYRDLRRAFLRSVLLRTTVLCTVFRAAICPTYSHPTHSYPCGELSAQKYPTYSFPAYKNPRTELSSVNVGTTQTSHFREHPFSTYAKFRPFFTPSPPRTQNDVIVTNKLIVLHTLLANPPYLRTY